MGQRDGASLDALGLVQFIKTPARLTMRDERAVRKQTRRLVLVHVDPQVHRAEHDERRRLVRGRFPGAGFAARSSPTIGARTVLRSISVSTVWTSASTTATAALASWRRAAMVSTGCR